MVRVASLLGELKRINGNEDPEQGLIGWAMKIVQSVEVQPATLASRSRVAWLDALFALEDHPVGVFELQS